MKKTICLLMAILLLAVLSAPAFAAAGEKITEPGQTMPDFTVQLTDGSSATLSELLKEKDLVVLNIFATWCRPCEIEFPYMEKVYEANSDRMTVLSLSADRDDTMEMVAGYKESHSLSFPMGLTGEALPFLDVPGYPTTFFIMKDGRVVFIKVGAFIAEGAFEEKVGIFLAEDYDGSALAPEKAVPFMSFLFLIIPVFLYLMRVAGRWRLFKKAGRPAWHSLVPFLSTYTEYDLCWKGTAGIFYLLIVTAIPISFRLLPHNDGLVLLAAAMTLAGFVISLLEARKLSGAFGKGLIAGIFLLIAPHLSRLILGFSGAQYQGKQGRRD